jgi:hypothetical protein
MGNYDYANESLGDTLRNNKKTAIGIGLFLLSLALIFGLIIPKVYAPEPMTSSEVTKILR